MRARHRARTLGNWVNLSTPLGLLVARAGRARLRAGPRGTYLASRYRLPFPVAGAFTVGSVIITPRHQDQLGPDLLAHEERHCWQWFALLGLPFLPAYGVALAWSWLRTGDLASANVFEVDAGLLAGGYRPRPPRSRRGGRASRTTGPGDHPQELPDHLRDARGAGQDPVEDRERDRPGRHD